MKRPRSSAELSSRRWRRPGHLLLLLAALYLLFLSLKLPRLLRIAALLSSADDPSDDLRRSALLPRDPLHRRLDLRPLRSRYGRLPSHLLLLRRADGDLSELERAASEAWTLGATAWEELEALGTAGLNQTIEDLAVGSGNTTPCPLSASMSHEELGGAERLMFLPCGLAAGSSITVIGTPQEAHVEYVPQLARVAGGDGRVMVSQFMVELQGLKAADGEDPPRILHLNPRVKGDWSKVPVIEHNTCYRMQWGFAQRCDGVPSRDDEDTVDGFGKCEKWIRDDIADSKESKTTSWLRRFIGRAKKPAMTWPFPFTEGRLFVLTIRAGVEGYHINVGGRHITSFPYRTGFTLEDATRLSVKGDIDVHSVYATSLPSSHPSFSVERVLEMSEEWKLRPLPDSRIDIFIGILSATNHFAERMAIRKTWMKSDAIKSSRVAVRFFVALNPRKEVNAMLKKEADYFADTVILPFMDRYELVVLKTIAICEYGVQNLTAAYIMKCDDDTFVRVDTVLKEIRSISTEKPLYMGNLNLLHRPLRNGKWAVTYEEWPEEIYPPYANGPGYVISIDIARFVVSQHANHSLKLFKMEDVSMGMWVEDFNTSNPVQYSHNWKFCQYGCMENYFTAHYQSPRQMICLWDKLARGRAQCCNFR